MFSFGWSELTLIAVIIIIVVGPKELPNLLKQIGYFSKSLKKITREFKSSLNEIANESDLKEVKESINEIKKIHKDADPTNDIKEEIDSIKKKSNVFSDEIKNLNSLDDNKKK